ncbi:MAG: protein kinase [Gemmatimonadaceae bacterium]|nr:protein kinase [Gemmatimonadaceae bacterium]
MTEASSRLRVALEGRYRLDRELGAGGMATVYLAHDLKHDRDVAIKVLHPDLGAALGGERFLSEIRTTARLQHPHILPLLDSGEADGLLYYVMPLVTGETLRARLERERQLPIADAVRIAREVASALDYAHRQHVIHRDIKPENILLHDGSALVADFGIALAVQSAGGQRMTQTGLSLGTPQYMSPEQAMGERTIDARSDIYALGAVTYEMLVGEAPFTGPSVQAIVARVLTEEPRSISVQRKAVPAGVEQAVTRALEKLPADRFENAKEFIEALSREGQPTVVRASASAPAARAPRGMLAALALLTVALGVVGFGWWRAVQGTAALEPAQFVVPLRDSVPLVLGAIERAGSAARPSVPAMAISPDGQTIVVAARVVDASGEKPSRLYRRRLSDERLQPIPGTDSASAPFFAPSGREIGFFVGGSLRSVSLTGDSARRIAEDSTFNGRLANSGSWGADGTIVFANMVGFWEVPATGGQPRRLQVADDDSLSGTAKVVRAPQLISGGARLLYHAPRTRDPRSSVLRLLDRKTGKVSTVLEQASHGTTVGDTLLLFMRGTSLMAVRFDAMAGTASGEPVTVERDVANSISTRNTGSDSNIGQYAVSAHGDLVVARGGFYPPQRYALLQRAPSGLLRQVPVPVADYGEVRSSPTGDRLVFSMNDVARGFGSTTAVFDLARELLTPVASKALFNDRPIWSRDGHQLVVEVDGAEGRDLTIVSLDGVTTPRRLEIKSSGQRAHEWLPDGTIVYSGFSSDWPGLRLWSPDGTVRRSLSTDSSAVGYIAFSPDFHWIASVKGRQVFVRPYPGPGSAVAVSGPGGTEPAWAPNGKQIYFVVPRDSTSGSARALMVADLSGDAPIRVARPRVVMPDFPALAGSSRRWDVMPDGSLMMIVAADTTPMADFNRAAIREIHVAQRALRGLRFGGTPSPSRPK